MANDKNLENGRATQFRSGEEAARNGQNGGIASGAARRRKRALKDAADYFLSLPVKDGRIRNKLLNKGIDPEDVDHQMAMIVGLYARAALGDAQAAKVLIGLLGDDSSSDSEGVQIVDDL